MLSSPKRKCCVDCPGRLSRSSRIETVRPLPEWIVDMDKSMMPTLGPLQFQRVPSAQVHSQSGRAPKLLLVSVPFAAIHRPNIGLSLLKAVVEERGFHCDIKYLHLDFAKQLGVEQYTYVGETGASSLLLGDAVFSKALYGQAVDFQRIWCEGRKTHCESLPPELEGALRRAEEAACTFIDDVVESVPWSDYSIVGFSAMFQTAPSLALARRIKTTVDNPPQTILGGPLCEGDPGEALHRHFGWIDYVCRGEGERLIVSLMRSLANGDASQLAHIPGLIYRDTNQNTIVNGTRTPPAILDTLPVPSYEDWVTQCKHLNYPVKEMQLPLETSRGCWWGAKSHYTFCGLNGESLAFRRKNPDRAFSEIMGLKRYGIAQIFAVDNILDHHYLD